LVKDVEGRELLLLEGTSIPSISFKRRRKREEGGRVSIAVRHPDGGGKKGGPDMH